MSDIRKEVEGSKGRFVIVHPEGDESELTFSILSPQTVIADHTGVAERHAREGVGLRLVEALVADARAEGYRIVPLCPFVNAQRRRHPDWADAFNV